MSNNLETGWSVAIPCRLLCVSRSSLGGRPDPYLATGQKLNG